LSNYVLIVDDNSSDQKLAKLLVESEGYVAILASDAHYAIDKLEDFDFKLFVIDIQMPHITGLDLLKRLKRMENVKNIPVLIMSGRNTTDDVRKAIDLGAADYVIKPIDPAVFSAKLAQILKNRRSEWTEYPIDDSHKSGFINEACEILTINEIGATVKYPTEIKPGSTKAIGGKLFDEIGIGTNMGRCYECRKINDDFFIAKFSFVGLKEEDRKKLRLYCRQTWKTHQIKAS